jgi:hypothetical protein
MALGIADRRLATLIVALTAVGRRVTIRVDGTTVNVE